MSERLIIVLIFTAIFLKELFVLMPENVFIHPFPFFYLQITVQSYVYFACSYLGMMIIAYIFSKILNQFASVACLWFMIQSVEFVDYLLTYNQPWFDFLGIAIGITLVKFVVLACFILYKFNL